MTTATKRTVNRLPETNGAPGPVATTISAPNLATVQFKIRGTTPLCISKFSVKARDMMREKQKAGEMARKGTKRGPKDFQAAYEGAKYRSADGWHGINANCFRSAMIAACRLVSFKMTVAKLCFFTEPDGYDAEDFTGLVRITKGEPRMFEAALPNANGKHDLRVRPLWEIGWEALLRIRFDADQFSVTDIANLLARAGGQVGICEGRPNSRNSGGIGWGLFEIVNE